jgi:hypothetical protein
MKAKNFTVHHHRRGLVEVKINPFCPSARCEWVVDVRPAEQSRKIPQQAKPANRPPADILDRAIRRIRFGRDLHSPAREFAVAEGEKQSPAAIPLGGIIQPVWKREMLQARKSREHAENVSQLAPALEATVHQLSHVGRESQAHQIQEINFTFGMPQADHVAGSSRARPECFDRVFHAARGEILEEGISGPEW